MNRNHIGLHAMKDGAAIDNFESDERDVMSGWGREFCPGTGNLSLPGGPLVALSTVWSRLRISIPLN